MAAIAGAPLIHVFSLREAGGRYHFFGFPPRRLEMPPHNQRDGYLHECAARFARDLEGVLKRDGFFWLGLTFGMYVLGLGLGWYYSSNSYLGGSN